MHKPLFSHLTILYDASFVAASISRYFFFSYTHISRRDSFSFFFTLQIYLFFYTNYLGIVIFRFLCAWLSSIYRRLTFTLLTLDVHFTSQIWSIYTNCRNVINAKTFFLIAQISARTILRTERKIVLKGFSTILVMQYLRP